MSVEEQIFNDAMEVFKNHSRYYVYTGSFTLTVAQYLRSKGLRVNIEEGNLSIEILKSDYEA